MANSGLDRRLRQLQRRAEQFLAGQGRLHDAEEVLLELAKLAPRGEGVWAFALRHLAELQLEAHPWRASLHLRELRLAGWETSETAAIFGLAQAMLGNFDAASQAYRRAVHQEPKNPWYRHNLGHILDEALGLPAQAWPHLKAAADLLPDEPEVQDSLEHCTKRLERRNERIKRAISRQKRDVASSLRGEFRAGSSLGGDAECTEEKPRALMLVDATAPPPPRLTSNLLGPRVEAFVPQPPKARKVGSQGVRSAEVQLRELLPSAGQRRAVRLLCGRWLVAQGQIRSGVKLDRPFENDVAPSILAAAVYLTVAEGKQSCVTQSALAKWQGLSPSTVSKAVGDVRRLLERS